MKVYDMYMKRNAIKAYMIKHIEYVCMCLRQNGSQRMYGLGFESALVETRDMRTAVFANVHETLAIIRSGNGSPRGNLT